MYKHSLDRKNVPAKGGIKSEGADQFYISKHIPMPNYNLNYHFLYTRIKKY